MGGLGCLCVLGSECDCAWVWVVCVCVKGRVPFAGGRVSCLGGGGRRPVHRVSVPALGAMRACVAAGSWASHIRSALNPPLSGQIGHSQPAPFPAPTPHPQEPFLRVNENNWGLLATWGERGQASWMLTYDL